ncbi:hypothetical protein [Streptomyces rimosus]|uniref:hypothetical protein n=1 Tax=Streptomyces rimosus TaxID=1927 RepID=UPI0004CC4878|nr:hypothetical protein [Streptomyces rimosus]
MQHIEFLSYPQSEQQPDVLWGIRIDGTDLRVHVADATRELWRKERVARNPAEEERFLLLQHDGLLDWQIEDAGRHFLGTPIPAFAWSLPGSTAVLGCSCGEWGCWPLRTVITATPETVTWSSFRQPFRDEWGELPMGPYVFARPAYDAALAEPVRCAEDPLVLPGETAR